MNMQHTYGIFDHEADHIIDLVRRHAPLDRIRGTPCPACGSAMTVTFHEDGHGFEVCCNGDPLHVSKFQEIDDPPTWWRECVIEPAEQNFYWRDWHWFDDAGNLTLKVSGYKLDGTHWNGVLECSTGDPDYAFWTWVITESGCTSDLINDAKLEELRTRFNRRE